MQGVGIIYLAVNSVNGKMYIGKTCRELSVRVAEHIRESNTRRRTVFSKAIAKYGVEVFNFTLLETCDLAELNACETLWIAVYDCMAPRGYNVTEGGDGTCGLKGELSPNYGNRWKHTPEVIDKMTAIQNEPERVEANRRRASLYNPLCDPIKRPAALMHLRSEAKSQWADPIQRAKKIEGLRRAWQLRKKAA